MSNKRFRIALSFGGEKRDFVAEVARILAKHFGKDGKDGKDSILYDKYHQAEFSRSDLAFHLGDLYEKEADLVVAVFCPDYENKEWCGLEWNAIYGLLKEVRFIAELASLNEAAAHGALSDLSSRALVVPDLEERCFALVPMVADFLRRLRPEVVAETSSRLEKRAYALIVENGYGEHDRFPILDAAWSTVAPALSLFIAGPNPRLQTVCNALNIFLDFTGRWSGRQRYASGASWFANLSSASRVRGAPFASVHGF